MTGSLFRGFAAPRIAVMAGYLLYVSAPAGAAAAAGVAPFWIAAKSALGRATRA